MQKFSEMSNEQLRHTIAIMLGWHIERAGDWVTLTNHDKTHSIVDRLESECWRVACEPVDWGGCALPNWPEDVGAALALPFMPYMVKLDQTMTELWECALRWGGEDTERYFAYCKTPARAICEAWCAMMDKEAEAQSEGGR